MNVENIENEVCSAVEVIPECEKHRKLDANNLCYLLISLIILAIGAVMLTAIFCEIELLITVMLGTMGIELVILGLLGIIVSIVQPDDFDLF